MKIEDITTWARGNGVPCHGDLVEGSYKGNVYRAEFYGDRYPGGKCYLSLAADSTIEVKTKDGWEKINAEDDDLFNDILNAITPEVENE